MREFQVEDVFVGRTKDSKLYVTAEVSIHADHDYTTVEHARVHRAVRISLSGAEIRKGGSFGRDGDWIGGGQMLDRLLDVVQVADPFTVRDLVAMHDVWRDFHLSDMQAACRHMALPEDKSFDAREHLVCEAGSGYRYGRAWLIVPESELEAPAERLYRALHLDGAS